MYIYVVPLIWVIFNNINQTLSYEINNVRYNYINLPILEVLKLHIRVPKK